MQNIQLHHIFFFLKSVLLIGQFISPTTSFDKASSCALFKDLITNLEDFSSETLKDLKIRLISKTFNLFEFLLDRSNF